MDAKTYAQQALDKVGTVGQVYWVACGGSVIDLYPAHCLVGQHSPSMESGIFTAAEFTALPPARLGEHSVVVTCSHSGGTRETVEACQLAAERGAAVLAMTNNAGSRIDNGQWPCWIYQWEDSTPQLEKPAGFTIVFAAELMRLQDGYQGEDALVRGIGQLDGIIAAAKPCVEAELGPRFVELCQSHDFLYILGSGPTFSQTYGFAICSLMEMQWQNCSYINSAEYFHGPFECTEEGVFYFLQKTGGATRHIDERAEDFLKTHTGDLMVLDSLDYGMDAVDADVRTYLDPIFFYEMNVSLRGVRGKAFDHSPEYRRYMGKVEY